MSWAAATFSAAAIIDAWAHGSYEKLSSTQASVTGVFPGRREDGYTSVGPLEVRSVVITATFEPWSASAMRPPMASDAAEVAHAWEIIGPVACGAPMRPAKVGPP